MESPPSGNLDRNNPDSGALQFRLRHHNSGFIAIGAGTVHSLGLKADGSIVAWGDNQYGQTNLPTPNTGFVAIAAGYWHNLGLKADGSIVAWGRNNDGQLNLASSNSGFVAISAGQWHNLGLKADGSIVAWGDGSNGQCNVAEPNRGFIAVAAGGYHSLGLKAGIASAISRGACDLDLNLTGPITSEPRQGGMSEVRLTFETTLGDSAYDSITIEERLCPPPGTYGPYAGAAATTSSPDGSHQLVITFSPPLESGRTYRFAVDPSVTGIQEEFVEARALTGDVNSDGRVDTVDRSIVVGNWTGHVFGCASDPSGDGVINGLDRSIVVGAWTGPENCAP